MLTGPHPPSIFDFYRIFMGGNSIKSQQSSDIYKHLPSPVGTYGSCFRYKKTIKAIYYW